MPEISLMPGIGISATGLEAERKRMEVIANNVANAQTTRAANGKVFQRKDVIFGQRLNEALGEGELGGVEVLGIAADQTPGRQVYRPGHPDADEEGFIHMPNVNSVAEMVDMMTASRAFEANLSAMKTSKMMAAKAIGILNSK